MIKKIKTSKRLNFVIKQLTKIELTYQYDNEYLKLKVIFEFEKEIHILNCCYNVNLIHSGKLLVKHILKDIDNSLIVRTKEIMNGLTIN